MVMTPWIIFALYFHHSADVSALRRILGKLLCFGAQTNHYIQIIIWPTNPDSMVCMTIFKLGVQLFPYSTQLASKSAVAHSHRINCQKFSKWYSSTHIGWPFHSRLASLHHSTISNKHPTIDIWLTVSLGGFQGDPRAKLHVESSNKKLEMNDGS